MAGFVDMVIFVLCFDVWIPFFLVGMVDVYEHCLFLP